jgi:hypothetical protein
VAPELKSVYMHRQRQQLRTAFGPLAVGLFHEEQLLFIDLLRLKKNAEPEFFGKDRKLIAEVKDKEASILIYYRSQEYFLGLCTRTGTLAMNVVQEQEHC